MTSEIDNDKGKNLSRFALVGIAAALVTMGLKTVAFLLTGSIGLLSDALESIVNLVGSSVTFVMLRIAARPADDKHSFGHSKAEYFASTLEGVLILIAALSIIYTAVERLLNPGPLGQLGIGLLIATFASLINLVVARLLIRTGKANRSISLEADGHHLMTDVWTSVGVVVGLVFVLITGWIPLDAIVAILVALNIMWTAFQLLRRSVHGLMDAALSPKEMEQITAVMDRYRATGVEFHALRTRQAARLRFISVHVLVKGEISLHDAHHIAEDFEADLRKDLPNSVITTHLEPIDDDISVKDANEVL